MSLYIKLRVEQEVFQESWTLFKRLEGRKEVRILGWATCSKYNSLTVEDLCERGRKQSRRKAVC